MKHKLKYMALAAFCAVAAPASAFTTQEQQTLSLAREFMQCMDDYNAQHDARRIPVQERIDRQEAENRRRAEQIVRETLATQADEMRAELRANGFTVNEARRIVDNMLRSAETAILFELNRRIDRSDLPRYESPRMVCERSLGTDYFDLSDQISTLNRKYGYSSVSQAIGGYFP